MSVMIDKNLLHITIAMYLFLWLFCVDSMNGQTKRALLIGISEYNSTQSDVSDNDWANIHGANDVDLLAATLKQQRFQITRITNRVANADRIRREIKRFALSCKSDDIVYIHFSCHGQPVEDMNGDEEDGWDEALIPVDAKKVYQKGVYTGEKHIIDDELNGYFRTIRKNVGHNGFVYVVLDACHAGSSYRGDEEEDSVIIRGTDSGFSMSSKPYVPSIDKRGKMKVEKSETMANICVLEACRSYQVNSEIKEKGKYYGSLSYYVNKVLQTIPLSRNISWTERVTQLMNQDTRLIRQNPVIETSL